MHLDLTSHRLQLAFNEITSILDTIDLYPSDESKNEHLLETISEKMNEAYKQIETAKSFSEFSSLLIAKVQNKPTQKMEKNEDLFPNADKSCKVINIDEEFEIEDEVFEEYIREEYLKPLSEDYKKEFCQNFKINTILKKNFMSELKQA